jgi:hypothetical protein
VKALESHYRKIRNLHLRSVPSISIPPVSASANRVRSCKSATRINWSSRSASAKFDIVAPEEEEEEDSENEDNED